MQKRKWLIYTVLFGLIPFFARVITYTVVKAVPLSYMFNELDIISFGLILNVTNISELESLTVVDQEWKTKGIGLSLLLIIMFALFLAFAYFDDAIKHYSISNPSNLEDGNIKYCALGLSAVSIMLSYALFQRINSLT